MPPVPPIGPEGLAQQAEIDSAPSMSPEELLQHMSSRLPTEQLKALSNLLTPQQPKTKNTYIGPRIEAPGTTPSNVPPPSPAISEAGLALSLQNLLSAAMGMGGGVLGAGVLYGGKFMKNRAAPDEAFRELVGEYEAKNKAVDRQRVDERIQAMEAQNKAINEHDARWASLNPTADTLPREHGGIENTMVGPGIKIYRYGRDIPTPPEHPEMSGQIAGTRMLEGGNAINHIGNILVPLKGHRFLLGKPGQPIGPPSYYAAEALNKYLDTLGINTEYNSLDFNKQPIPKVTVTDTDIEAGKQYIKKLLIDATQRLAQAEAAYKANQNHRTQQNLQDMQERVDDYAHSYGKISGDKASARKAMEESITLAHLRTPPPEKLTREHYLKFKSENPQLDEYNRQYLKPEER